MDDKPLEAQLDDIRESIVALAGAVDNLDYHQRVIVTLLEKIVEAVTPTEPETDLRSLIAALVATTNAQNVTLTQMVEVYSGLGKTIEGAFARSLEKARDLWK